MDTSEVPNRDVSRGVRPLRAIRLKCLDCCCGSASEVKLCHIQSCALWPFRLGKNPNRKGLGGSFKKEGL